MTVPIAAATRASRGSTTGWLAVGAAAVGATLLAGRGLGLHVAPCTLRAHTGVPCPACGLTRLLVGLGHGHLGQAVSADLPGLLLVVAIGVVVVAQAVATSGRPVPWLRAPALPVALAALLAAHWGLTVLTGGLPSTA